MKAHSVRASELFYHLTQARSTQELIDKVVKGEEYSVDDYDRCRAIAPNDLHAFASAMSFYDSNEEERYTQRVLKSYFNMMADMIGGRLSELEGLYGELKDRSKSLRKNPSVEDAVGDKSAQLEAQAS